MIIEDDILVLKETKYKDNDKILQALSRNNGKLQILARGCRKNKSPLVNIAQIMSLSKATLYDNRDMYLVNSAELINSFYNIRNNLTAFMYGSYVLELLNYVSQESQVDSKVFDMTVKLLVIFNLSDNEADNIPKLVSMYELKLISMLGFKPELTACIECGAPVTKDGIFIFNYLEGGLQCCQCNVNALKNKFKIENALVLDEIIKAKFEDEGIYPKITKEVSNIIRNYLFTQIGRSNFTTLNMIEAGIY